MPSRATFEEALRRFEAYRAGNEFAMQEGDLLDCEYIETDGDFPCCSAGAKKLFNPDAGVFYFRCYGDRSPPRWWEFWRWGEKPTELHDLDGQLTDEGYYVGIYPRFDLNADRF